MDGKLTLKLKNTKLIGNQTKEQHGLKILLQNILKKTKARKCHHLLEWKTTIQKTVNNKEEKMSMAVSLEEE